MLQTLWNRISNVGLDKIPDTIRSRNVMFTNRLVFIIFIILFILFIFNLSYQGWTVFTQSILFGNIAAFITINFFNRIGYSEIGRLILSWMCSIYPFYSSVNAKLADLASVEEAMYYMPRLFIMTTSIIPILTFSFKEKQYLIAGLLGSFIPLVFFDPLHNMMGVGYYEIGFNANIYPTFNAITIASYLVFLTATVFFKRMNEKYNTELILKTDKIKEQAFELKSANHEIIVMNKNLEKVLNKRTKKLLDQAVQFQVYSFKNSHELRAPLAKIMGTIQLLNQQDLSNHSEIQRLLKILNKACVELDVIVHDINEVLSNDVKE